MKKNGYFVHPANYSYLAGSNNLLEIYLKGISANATVNASASSPPEPAGTNVVNVYQ